MQFHIRAKRVNSPQFTIMTIEVPRLTTVMTEVRQCGSCQGLAATHHHAMWWVLMVTLPVDFLWSNTA